MAPMRNLAGVGVLALVGACGGGGGDPEPLLGGAVSGSYEGNTFMAVNGVADHLVQGEDEAYVIALGDADLNCGSASSPSPPSGRFAAIQLSELTEATYANVYVNLYENVDGFHGTGQNSGSVVLTTVTEDHVEGSVAFDATIEGQRYMLSGSFDVVRCPE